MASVSFSARDILKWWTFSVPLTCKCRVLLKKHKKTFTHVRGILLQAVKTSPHQSHAPLSWSDSILTTFLSRSDTSTPFSLFLDEKFSLTCQFPRQSGCWMVCHQECLPLQGCLEDLQAQVHCHHFLVHGVPGQTLLVLRWMHENCKLNSIEKNQREILKIVNDKIYKHKQTCHCCFLIASGEWQTVVAVNCSLCGLKEGGQLCG